LFLPPNGADSIGISDAGYAADRCGLAFRCCMTSAGPTPDIVDTLESGVDEAIAICDGDVRAALRAALVYNVFLERKLEHLRSQISTGFARGQIRKAPPRVKT
jgi:hypothetical protein